MWGPLMQNWQKEKKWKKNEIQTKGCENDGLLSNICTIYGSSNLLQILLIQAELQGIFSFEISKKSKILFKSLMFLPKH